MNVAQHQSRSENQGGYSLVELLLTTTLLLLFAGLAVVSMQAMRKGSEFAEGTIRFETMLRFARAEAARSGHRVRVNFLQETNALVTTTNELSQVQVSWEPNPATEPDVFQDLLTAHWGVDQVNEMVRVQKVRVVGSFQPPPDLDTNQAAATADGTPDGIPASDDYTNATPDAMPAYITFNPDGSCDAAEITLVAAQPEDERQVVLRLEGFTGSVSRVDPQTTDQSADGQPPDQPANAPTPEPPANAPAPGHDQPTGPVPNRSSG